MSGRLIHSPQTFARQSIIGASCRSLRSFEQSQNPVTSVWLCETVWSDETSQDAVKQHAVKAGRAAVPCMLKVGIPVRHRVSIFRRLDQFWLGSDLADNRLRTLPRSIFSSLAYLSNMFVVVVRLRAGIEILRLLHRWLQGNLFNNCSLTTIAGQSFCASTTVCRDVMQQVLTHLEQRAVHFAL